MCKSLGTSINNGYAQQYLHKSPFQRASFNYDAKLRLYIVFILNFYVLLKKETYLEKYYTPIYPAPIWRLCIVKFLLLSHLFLYCFFMQIQVNINMCSYIKDRILLSLSYTMFFKLTIYPGYLSISVHRYWLFLLIVA